MQTSKRALIAAFLAALICGCTTTVRTSPDSVSLDAAAVSHLPPRNVTVVNGHASETELKFKQGPYTMIVEPKQMTDTAVEMLRRALAARGGKGAAKRVTLRVHSPRQTGPSGAIATGLGVTVDAEYGDGTRSQVSGQGYSARGANRSFEAAILQALNQLVGDRNFVAYMKR